MDAEKVFGKVLRDLRQQRKLSQEKLAFDADLNRQFVSLLELGERSPSLGTLYKLANGLGLSGSDLLKHVEAHMQLAKSSRTTSSDRKARKMTGKRQIAAARTS